MDGSAGGLTLALPESAVATLLPSLNADASTVELSDVLKIIAQYTRATEFYTNGNPVLNRVAVQSRVRELIAAVTQDATAAPQQDGGRTDPQSQDAKAAPRPQKVNATRRKQAVAEPQAQAAKVAARQRRAKAGPRPHAAKASPRQQGVRK
jgi:hypothetical protein